MEGLEFYIINDQLWVLDETGTHTMVEESNRELVTRLFEMIVEYWPEAFKALSKEFKSSSANVQFFQWLIVRRFYKCNFGKLDTTTLDINRGSFNFEKVDCPLRGECKLEGIVCCPKFNSNLTQMQMRVMEQVFYGKSIEKISEMLFISQNTVKNHIKASYWKLGIHEKAEFIRYATEKNLFSSHNV